MSDNGSSENGATLDETNDSVDVKAEPEDSVPKRTRDEVGGSKSPSPPPKKSRKESENEEVHEKVDKSPSASPRRSRNDTDNGDDAIVEEGEKQVIPPPKKARKEKENNGDAAVKEVERSLSPSPKKSRKEKDDETGKDRKEKDTDRKEKSTRKSDRRSTRGRSKSRSRSPSGKKRRVDDKEKDRKKDSRSHRDDHKEKTSDRKEKDSDRKERDSHRKDKDTDRKDKDRRESRGEEKKKEEVESVDPKQDDIEEGEVPEPPKVLTARELERQRIMEEEMKNGNDDDVADEPVWSMRRAQLEKSSRSCPYLDTIDRSVLDFDFEKLCSVSMSTLNVYACMICGKYFQGRGTNTHAYTHSLDGDHRVFLNLATLRFYCLPDNYEVNDPSLDDIKYVLKPTYSKQLIGSLATQIRMARAYDDSTYYPGVVGLNNIKANDYCNVVLHALSHVAPLRDFFLREENYSKLKRPPGDLLTELPKRFGELLRKLWNPKAFRKHVSPHEMLQATVLCSDKKFQFIEQGDAAEFMNFLLNTLHTALNGNTKSSSSIIYKTFRGRMRQYSRRVIPAEATDDQRRQLLQMPEYQETSKEIPFLYLTMDLPPAPLYRDAQMENIIPQVPLHVLLGKFNGTTEKEYKTYNENIMKRFELIRLPEYLIITYKRFHKNQWFIEKNPTIVNFPISNVDFYDCLTEDAKPLHKYTTYDLVCNVVHEGRPENGSYRAQLVHQGSQKWFELEDLHVKEILPQMIVLAESYIQVWRLNKTLTREERLAEGTNNSMES